MTAKNLLAYSGVLREHGYQPPQTGKLSAEAINYTDDLRALQLAVLGRETAPDLHKSQGQQQSFTLGEIKGAMEGKTPSPAVEESIPPFFSLTEEEARRRWREEREGTRLYPKPRKGEGIGDDKARVEDRVEIGIHLQNELLRIQQKAYGQQSIESARSVVQVTVALLDNLSQAFGMPLKEFYEQYAPKLLYDGRRRRMLGYYSSRKGYEWARGVCPGQAH